MNNQKTISILKSIALTVLVCSGLAFSVQGAGAQTAVPGIQADAHGEGGPVSAKAGLKLYTDKGCYLCHGYAAQGSPMSGPPLTNKANFDYLRTATRTPRDKMPPFFPEQLSDNDLRNIAAYLQSLPDPKEPKDIPLLN